LPNAFQPVHDVDPPMTTPPLILASTSPFRRQLLARLGLPFETANPAVDEALLPDETTRSGRAPPVGGEGPKRSSACTPMP
jgi:alkanesulfonate monooxygenase SsuD/methylene tetrahydromethanopterin reductase-like flavin-dependent oxidoreductase (luciferase family)